MVRLSIIIPFYNVEQYIAQCLDSVYQQDIPEEEYEVICVNDASPDGSREIVKEYQKRHTNLILVEHEQNKKLGAARNTGRKAARGKYIWNIDSDDMIAPNCLKDILELVESNKAEVLLFDHMYIYGEELIKEPLFVFSETDGTITGIDFFSRYTSKELSPLSPVWRMVISKEYLDSKQIYSPEINMSEDVPYTFNVMLHATRLKVIEAPYYYHRYNFQSIGFELMKAPSTISAYESCFIASKGILRLVDEFKHAGNDVTNKVKIVGLYCMCLYSRYYSRMVPEEKSRFLRVCREHFFQNLFFFKYASLKDCYRYIVFIAFGKVKQ